jgi:hypothetical protein
MRFDPEGHIVITPRQFLEAFRHDPERLVLNALLPGTPWSFPTHDNYCEFRNYISHRLNVHAQSLVVRGSTKLGFSIRPTNEKAWMALGPVSDIDIAIVDPDYFTRIDNEVRQWERGLGRGLTRVTVSKLQSIRRTRGFSYLRFFDLPETPALIEYGKCFAEAPVEACCGAPRPISAFFYRDWWSVASRWKFDIRCLATAVDENRVAAPPDEPRAYSADADIQDDVNAPIGAAQQHHENPAPPAEEGP